MTQKIVLYHGSLEELNSRNPNEQYEFHNKYGSYISTDFFYNNQWSRRISGQILADGYAGLINRRTNFILRGLITQFLYANVEGTPIVRKEKPKEKKKK